MPRPIFRPIPAGARPSRTASQNWSKRYQGRRAICFHHRAAFMWSAYLMGIDRILMGFLTEPEMVEMVMDKVLACNMEIVRRAIRAGPK